MKKILALAAFLFGLCPAPTRAITVTNLGSYTIAVKLIQHTSNTGSSTTPTCTSLPNAPSAVGNLLVALVTTGANPTINCANTCSAALTWSTTTQRNNGTVANLRLFFRAATGSESLGPLPFDTTISATNPWTCILAEFSGVQTSLDTQGAGTSFTATTAWNTTLTAAANAGKLFIEAGSASANHTFAGFTGLGATTSLLVDTKGRTGNGGGMVYATRGGGFSSSANMVADSNATGVGNTYAFGFSGEGVTANVAPDDSIMISYSDRQRGVGASAGTITVSDTLGGQSGTYTLDVEHQVLSATSLIDTHLVHAFYTSANITHPTSVTFRAFRNDSNDTPTEIAVSVTKITGLTRTANADSTANAGSDATLSTAADSGNTATTAQGSEVVYGPIGWLGTATFTTGAGLTIPSGETTPISVTGDGGTLKMQDQFKIVSVTGAYKINGTLSANSAWAALVANYKGILIPPNVEYPFDW